MDSILQYRGDNLQIDRSVREVFRKPSVPENFFISGDINELMLRKTNTRKTLDSPPILRTPKTLKDQHQM